MHEERSAPHTPAAPANRWMGCVPTGLEQIIEGSSPQQREALLAQARQQGCLFGHQLNARPGRNALTFLEQPTLGELGPLTASPVDFIDQTLDQAQREAVARALATPDLSLIQGLPGTGKSRAVVEILAQACRRGERVLLLSHGLAALERVLAASQANPDLLPRRLDDCGARPPERFRNLAESALERSRESLAGVEQRCQAWKEREQTLDEARALVGRFSSNGAHDEHQAKSASVLAQVRARTAQVREQLARLDHELDETRQLVAAREANCWWSLAWWRATLRGAGPESTSRLEADQAQAQRELDELGREEQRLLEEPARLRQQSEQDQQRLVVLWGQISQEAGLENGQAGTPSLEALSSLERRLAERRGADESQCSFIRDWVRFLEQDQDELSRSWLAFANPVAGTFADFARQANKTTASFDLAIVQDADLASAEELLLAARHARRLVLVGESSCTRAPAAGSFAALWRDLHAEPRRLPYAWTENKNGLRCRLCHFTSEERDFLECEKVEDHADIELGILARPGTRPTLAEVVFPSSLGIGAAKRYIYRELEELPVAAAGADFVWSQRDDRSQLRFGDDGPAAAERIELEPGVFEIVARFESRWQTLGLDFEHAAGWNPRSAADWVKAKLDLRDLGRTTRLDVPHRMDPDLAAFLSLLLFAGEYRTAPGRNGSGHRNGSAAQVEFVSVMPLAGSGRSKNGKAARPRKEGAGLELDLADPKNHERLPAAVRAGLPECGFVNYLEAQAIVRVLENLAADPKSAGLGAIAVIALYSAQAALIRRLVEQSETLKNFAVEIEIDVPGSFRQRESSLVLVSLTRSHKSRAVSFGDSPRSLALALTRARSRLILFGDPGTLICRSQWAGAVDHLDADSSIQERELIAHLVSYFEGTGPCQRSFSLRASGST